jgi:hypothetical protein
MPYLTFAIYTKPKETEKESTKPEEASTEDTKALETTPKVTTTKENNVEKAIPIALNKLLSAAYHTEKTRNNDVKNVGKSDAKEDWKKLHASRTLDEFYYHSLQARDVRLRDANQVVT